MRNTVLLVGVEDPEPKIPGVVFVRARPGEIGQAAKTGAGILVLGDEALRDCNPGAVKKMLRRRRRIVILSPVRTGCCRILAWGSEGFYRAAPPGGLAEAIREALEELNAGLVRPLLDLQDWWKAPPPPRVQGRTRPPRRPRTEVPPLRPGVDPQARLVLPHALPPLLPRPRGIPT